MKIRSFLAALAVVGTSTASMSVATPSATADAPPARPILKLNAPASATVYSWGGYVDITSQANLTAGNDALEFWSRKAKGVITTEWRSGATSGTLPVGTQTKFTGLTKMVTFRVKNAAGVRLRTFTMAPCLNDTSTRSRPDAQLRSPYPRGCSWSSLTRGFVFGLPAGWSTPLTDYSQEPIRLAPGKYTVEAFISPVYRDALGISAADARKSFALTVVKSPECSPEDCGGFGDEGYRTPTGPALRPALRPAATKPTQRAEGGPVGPMPDLQALPAFGMRIDRRTGNFLQFSADVWNAGTSPLLVDGFRRDGEQLMDAYQYFVDADGNQTGYEQVGTMEWDPRSTHQHWHFKDFAEYSLLKEDQSLAVRSDKEAFCLAPTDPIDLTVPGADWTGKLQDLSTSCGDLSAASVREALPAGFGDTYEQFRDGQSFNLKGLSNGHYWIKVEANPVHRLRELDTTNNVGLRKVTIGGKTGARTLKWGWV